MIEEAHGTDPGAEPACVLHLAYFRQCLIKCIKTYLCDWSLLCMK